MNFKQIVQDYFTFSRSERKGITILLVIIFLLAITNKVIFYFETPAVIDTDLINAELNLSTSAISDEKRQTLFLFDPNTINQAALDTLAVPSTVKNNLIRYREKGGHYDGARDVKKLYGVTDSIFNIIEPYIKIEPEKNKPEAKKINRQLVNFNPNTASDSVFLLLGITQKQIGTIRNYQQKGGIFYKKEDFFRIYSLTETQKKELASYVVIENNDRVKKKTFDREILMFEINSADSVELMKLPGIGTKLSKRIVKYRDLLGGFYNFEQLKEVYGLNQETISRIHGMITVEASKVRKIDLNFADRYELAKHPYIGYEKAGQIIRFRTKNGKIQDPLVLKDSMILKAEDYEKLKPYL